MFITRTAHGLLEVDAPSAVRVLFMAPYAPEGPEYGCNPAVGAGGYPLYHYNVFRRLQRLGFAVESTSRVEAILHAGGAADYVFSLFNRMRMGNPEVFVSAHCAYLGIPCLGAPPNVRAVAEDKYASKLLARSLGIPVPHGVPYHRGVTPLDQAPFPGPYFVKDRFGAASERITAESAQDEWSGARRVVESLWEDGTDALVEEFAPGIDITVPVIGDEAPRVLGVYHPRSDQPGAILTRDLKLTDHLGYQELDFRADWLREDVARIWDALGPIDYFRADYRLDETTGQRRFLEFNICCYIGQHGPFGMAADREGWGMDALLGHVVAFSLLRQRGLGGGGVSGLGVVRGAGSPAGG